MSSTIDSPKAAGFDRPLLLTPSQDIVGYVTNKAGMLFLFLVTCLSVIAVLLIFAFIIGQAWPFFAEFGFTEFFTRVDWHPEQPPPIFGALSLVGGSLYVTAGALMFAVPLGILAAVFLSDIVSFKIRNLIKPVIEILAAIPSVTYGFFAIMVVAPWMQNKLGFSSGTNILNASIILAIMAIPTIISVSEDSLTALGRDLREASYGLGATRAETICRVILPASHSGIIAAVILGMMRAIGETMVVWMAAGNAGQLPSPWWDLSTPVRTMTATIAGDMGEAPAGSDHRHALFAVGLTLLVFTFVLNMVSEYFLARASQSLKGKKK